MVRIKVCKHCWQPKELYNDYYKGKTNICKKCFSEQRKKRYREDSEFREKIRQRNFNRDPEYVRAHAKKYRTEQKERYLKTQRTYRGNLDKRIREELGDTIVHGRFTEEETQLFLKTMYLPMYDQCILLKKTLGSISYKRKYVRKKERENMYIL